jgi:dipeptidyl-peptidase-4
MLFARFSAALLGATCLIAANPVLASDTSVSAPAAAQALTFDRVFASPSLSGQTPRGVKLSPDGHWLTLLRARADERERFDLWGFDRKSGKWVMLIDSKKLSSGATLSEAEKMQRERLRIGDLKGIVSYSWSADSKSVLVPLDGALYLAGLDGSVRKVETGADPLNPALSSTGKSVSFVRDRRFWVVPVDGGKPIAITPEEASPTVHWGEAEFVAQEEMARFKGAWWSPDDSLVAIERFDEAHVGIVTRTSIGATGTKTYDQRYPAAGTPNVEVSIWVVKPDGSGRVQVDLGADKDIYVTRVDWAPGGKALYVQRQNRDQTKLDMLKVDPATGKTTVLFTETARAKMWLNVGNDYRFLKDGTLIWASERDGFAHLYRFDPKGDTWTQLTKGDWVVTSLDGVDEKGGKLYFTGTRDDVLAPQVYALNYTHGASEPQRLTELGYANGASVDRSAQMLLVNRSGPAQPPQVYLADTTGKRLTWIEENSVEGAHPYAPYMAAHRAPSFGTIKADDGTVLHYKMITPVMVPGKVYPVFFEHYGGPHSQVVTKGWTSPLAEAIVAKGYIYFELDNRGSPNRGVAFESAIWHAMGSIEVSDQLDGARFLKTLPYVDGKKIATYGWSYGGYMTLKMLSANPGVYAAGIAGAPVTDWKLYDTYYTERYMGDPRTDAAAYEAAGVLGKASNIGDPLLLLHGLSDDNVVFENSSALISKFQGEAKPFEMMLYPGQTHAVRGPKISVSVWNTIFNFLARHGVTPP